MRNCAIAAVSVSRTWASARTRAYEARASCNSARAVWAPSGEEFELVISLLIATGTFYGSQGIGPTAGFAEGFDSAKFGGGEPGLRRGVG